MTAIGFLLLVFCLPTFTISRNLSVDRIGQWAFLGSLIGVVLLAAGIAMWLWRVMP